MNRATLTAQVAERSKLSKLAAERAVEAVLQGPVSGTIGATEPHAGSV